VQAFINSHYDLEHGTELFATPAGLRDWLSAHGLIARADLGPRDLRRAIAVRESLRALARANADADRPGNAAIAALNEAADGATVQIRFDRTGARFKPSGRDDLDSAIGLLLAIVAAAMIDGSWSRLKVCPGRHCGWAFYDNSRNQSGRWCSMAVCGGREKARTHYRRRRAGADRR
jgi:predicted RNA-binding Zn ribbon-like protein